MEFRKTMESDFWEKIYSLVKDKKAINGIIVKEDVLKFLMQNGDYLQCEGKSLGKIIIRGFFPVSLRMFTPQFVGMTQKEFDKRVVVSEARGYKKTHFDGIRLNVEDQLEWNNTKLGDPVLIQWHKDTYRYLTSLSKSDKEIVRRQFTGGATLGRRPNKAFVERLEIILHNAPKTPKDMYVYRGIKDVFDLNAKTMRQYAAFSTTTRVAFAMSWISITPGAFIYRFKIKKGQPALFIGSPYTATNEATHKSNFKTNENINVVRKKDQYEIALPRGIIKYQKGEIINTKNLSKEQKLSSTKDMKGLKDVQIYHAKYIPGHAVVNKIKRKVIKKRK